MEVVQMRGTAFRSTHEVPERPEEQVGTDTCVCVLALDKGRVVFASLMTDGNLYHM